MTDIGAGQAIALRALAEIGTPFRLHGRKPGVALDCIGLVATAIGGIVAPIDYRLKGGNVDIIITYLENCGWVSEQPYVDMRDGDIAVVQCAPRQLHMMVRAQNGWVHSHAGLKKVVHMPDPPPWPIIAMLRLAGD